MKMARAVLLLLAFILAGVPAAQAQTGAPPPGMTQQQFDALVEAISRSVVARMKEGGTVAAAKPAPADAGAAGTSGSAEEMMAAFVDRAGTVLSSFPLLARELARIPAALDESASGGRGLWLFLVVLAVAACATVLAEAMVRRVLGPFRSRLESSATASSGWHTVPPLLGLLVTDAAALGAVWLVGYGILGTWFGGSDNQSRLASAVLVGIFSWRLYMFAFRIVLRPDLPGARLAAMDDAGAVAVYNRISIVVIGIIAVGTYLRILLALGSPSETISLAKVVGNIVIFGLFVWCARASREPMAQWFASLGRSTGRRTIGEAIGRNWLAVALPFFALLLVAQVYGAIAFRPAIPAAMLLTLNVVIALIFFETVIDHLARPHRISAAAGQDEPEPAGASSAVPRFGTVVARCVRVAAFVGAGALVAQTWIVDVIAMVDRSGWQSMTRSSLTTAGTIFAAFVAWELIKFTTVRYGARLATGDGSMHDLDEEPGAGGASRLATMMPLLRVALAIVIVVIGGLIVLSELGVNITPLIAGASVFGLAISFGSQTLVRDIVSGIFYLADDAFRVGEYIDCGKAKGTVEGFTLRSLRLRHQNGQVHTIPFGQLGQITNFSRDWTTVKFNLRLARNTDLEKLRRTVKKIGIDMQEDPELKAALLQPLKMQGVDDIADNAMIVRFKFTVKPGQTQVQREAIKRMVAAFGPAGIEFANATVAVQTLGAPLDTAGAAAAAAQAIARASAAAEAAAL